MNLTTRLERVAGVAALALAAAACTGPVAPLEIASKDIPVDILLGESYTPPPRPGSVNPGPIGFPGFIHPPIPRDAPGPGTLDPPPPRACPIANPVDAAVLVARASAPLPPVERGYAYRNAGTFRLAGGAESEYPPETQRRVTAVTEPTEEGDYSFEVAVPLGLDVTTTTYRVVNDPGSLDRGIFITRIVTQRRDGTDAFVPRTPILLMPFPPPEFGTNLEDELDSLRGQNYRSSGTDPVSQTTMVLEASVRGKGRTDACGEWIDAFDIEIIEGRIVGPLKQISFVGSYLIATQYGGLIVEDDIEMTGTDALRDVASDNRARINTVPAEPLGTE